MYTLLEKTEYLNNFRGMVGYLFRTHDSLRKISDKYLQEDIATFLKAIDIYTQTLS